MQGEITELKGLGRRITLITSAIGGVKQVSLPTLCFREIITVAGWRLHYKGSRVGAENWLEGYSRHPEMGDGARTRVGMMGNGWVQSNGAC